MTQRAKALRPDEWERWKAHPVTEIFMGFLRDYALMIRESWATGANWTETAKIQVQEREDIVNNLTLQEIQEFYSESDEDTERAPDPDSSQ